MPKIQTRTIAVFLIVHLAFQNTGFSAVSNPITLQQWPGNAASNRLACEALQMPVCSILSNLARRVTASRNRGAYALFALGASFLAVHPPRAPAFQVPVKPAAAQAQVAGNEAYYRQLAVDHPYEVALAYPKIEGEPWAGDVLRAALANVDPLNFLIDFGSLSEIRAIKPALREYVQKLVGSHPYRLMSAASILRDNVPWITPYLEETMLQTPYLAWEFREAALPFLEKSLNPRIMVLASILRHVESAGDLKSAEAERLLTLLQADSYLQTTLKDLLKICRNDTDYLRALLGLQNRADLMIPAWVPSQFHSVATSLLPHFWSVGEKDGPKALEGREWDKFAGASKNMGIPIVPYDTPYIFGEGLNLEQQMQDLAGTPIGNGRNGTRVVSLADGRTLGFLDGPALSALSPNITRVRVQNPAGDPLSSLTCLPYARSTGVYFPTTPPRWRRFSYQTLLKGEMLPVFSILKEDANGNPTEARLAGYIRRVDDVTGLLLNTQEKPIARLESIRLAHLKGADPALPSTTVFTSPLGENERLLIAPATRSNEQTLGKLLGGLKATTREARLMKIALTKRLLEMQIQLGDRRPPRMDMESARAALPAFKALPTDRLFASYTSGKEQEIISKALSQISPWYALTLAAVKELKWEHDEDILSHIVWGLMNHLNNVPRPGLSHAELEKVWTKQNVQAYLIDALHFNSLSTLEEIQAFFEKLPIQKNPALDHETDRGGLDTWKGTGSFLQVRARGMASPRTLAMLKMVALQRAGYETKLWLPKMEPQMAKIPGDARAKTIQLIQEPILMFYPTGQVVQYYLMGPEELIGSLGPRRARDLITLPDQNFPAFVKAFADRTPFYGRTYALWQARSLLDEYENHLAGRRAADLLNTAQSAAAWYWLVEEGIGDSMQMASFFKVLAAREQAELADDFDRLTRERGVSYTVEALEGEALERAKANYMIALRRLPVKFLDGLLAIHLKGDSILFESRELEWKDGRFVERTEVRLYNGYYQPSQAKVVVGEATRPGAIKTAIHEMAHDWGSSPLVGKKQIQRQRLRMDLVELFNSISWTKNQSSYSLRNPNQPKDIPEFRGNTHSLLNPHEDLAGRFDEYVENGRAFRHDIRDGVTVDHFRQAAKYLFCKYIMLLDEDGLAVEYELNAPDREPLTFESVLFTFWPLTRDPRLGQEATRLYQLVEEIQKRYEKEIQNGPIVQRQRPPTRVTHPQILRGA